LSLLSKDPIFDLQKKIANLQLSLRTVTEALTIGATRLHQSSKRRRSTRTPFRHSLCHPELIQSIIDEHNNNWKHRPLGCKPANPGQKLLYWQDCELDPNVWHNLLWATITPEWMDDDDNDTFN
jgi:hypothetical protein